MFFFIFLLSIVIFCFYIIVRNIVILIHAINNKNIKIKDKIHKIRDLVLQSCIAFFWSSLILSIFSAELFNLTYPLSLLKIPMLTLMVIIVFLPYLFRSDICDFLIKRFLCQESKKSHQT